jgi:hypothetical protein
MDLHDATTTCTTMVPLRLGLQLMEPLLGGSWISVTSLVVIFKEPRTP